MTGNYKRKIKKQTFKKNFKREKFRSRDTGKKATWAVETEAGVMHVHTEHRQAL